MGENLGAKLVSKCFSTAVVHRGFLSRYLGRKSDLTDAGNHAVRVDFFNFGTISELQVKVRG